MGKQIGLGFIGCGKHARQSHMEIAAQMPDIFKIVSVYDNDQQASNRVTDIASGIKIAQDPLELFLNKDVDAVIIATPPKFHLNYASTAIEAGKHVLCEKPLWNLQLDNDRGANLIRHATQQGLVFTSCHPRRFEPEYDFLKKYLDQQRSEKDFLKNLVEFNFRFFYHKPPATWRMHDSLLMDHMNHEIDLLHFLLGYGNLSLKMLYDAPDRYAVRGLRDDDLSLFMSGHRRLKEKKYYNELELIFDRGRLVSHSMLTNGIVESYVQEEAFDRNTITLLLDETRSATESFRLLMESFAKTIRNEAPNYLTEQDLVINTTSCNQILLHNAIYIKSDHCIEYV